MTSHMPPIPPGNQSNKGPKANADAAKDTVSPNHQPLNEDEQGQTANVRQNTTNKGFFKGRRIK